MRLLSHRDICPTKWMAENSWHSNVGKYAIHGAHEYGHHHHYTKQIITIIALYYTTLLMSCSCYCKLQYSGNYATNHWYEYVFVVCIMFTSSAALWKCITSWLILFWPLAEKASFNMNFDISCHSEGVTTPQINSNDPDPRKPNPPPKSIPVLSARVCR